MIPAPERKFMRGRPFPDTIPPYIDNLLWYIGSCERVEQWQDYNVCNHSDLHFGLVPELSPWIGISSLI